MINRPKRRVHQGRPYHLSDDCLQKLRKLEDRSKGRDEVVHSMSHGIELAVELFYHYRLLLHSNEICWRCRQIRKAAKNREYAYACMEDFKN